jgi:methylenetetrahydrofolate reductase (NADPH)
MENGTSISEFLKKGEPLFSLEFFPPKNESGGERMLKTASVLKPYNPDFVSITYGAGGGTRRTTMKYARMLKNDFGFEVMPHLTCVGHTKSELLEILEEFSKEGFCNVMALRGDPPEGETEFRPVQGGLCYATELVALVREYFPHFGIGVGGYPEKHPESPNKKIDLLHLREKVDAGADFITTQLFFDNQVYFKFFADCKAEGIEIPIIPGLLPVLSLGQVQRFCKMCDASLPALLNEKLQNASDEKQPGVGSDWAREQVIDLLNGGAPGFHLYALNQFSASVEILNGIKSLPPQ